MTAVAQRQSQQPELPCLSPLLGDWPFTHARASGHTSRVECQHRTPPQVATPGGSNVNTELPHKVKKCTDMARNTVNNKLTTSKHYKTSKSTHQRVSVKYNHPTPPAFDCWTPNNPPADRSRPGLYTHASLDGAPPPGFESLAWPESRRKAGDHVFAKSRRYQGQKPPGAANCPKAWQKHATLGAPCPLGFLKGANCPQDLTEFAKT